MPVNAIILAASSVIGSQPVKGDDEGAKKLHGTWRLTSVKLQVGDASQARDVFGAAPRATGSL